MAPSLRSDDPRYYDVTSFDCSEWSTYRREAQEAKINEQIKTSTYSKTTFTDVNEGDWYYDAVTTLAHAGILTGYEDGSFQPNKAITIGEMAALICRIDAGLTVETFDAVNGVNNTLTTGRYGERTWTEPTSWAHDYIMTTRRTTGPAVQTGYIRWNPEAFGETVTRGEAMRIAVEFARKIETNIYVVDGLDGYIYFNKLYWLEDIIKIPLDSDMSQYIGDYDTLKYWTTSGIEYGTEEYWHAYEHFYTRENVELAYQLGIVNGTNSNGDCEAEKAITRAEFCQMIYNMGIEDTTTVGYFHGCSVDNEEYVNYVKNNCEKVKEYYLVDGRKCLEFSKAQKRDTGRATYNRIGPTCSIWGHDNYCYAVDNTEYPYVKPQ